MAKRPRRAPPARRPGNPGFSSPQRTNPKVLKTLLKTSQNFPPRFPLIFPSPAPKVLHKNPVTGKGPIKRTQRRGAGGCGISRGVSGAGRPDSRFWQREQRGGVRGFPVTSVKVMEMQVGRRPVYGGPVRIGRIKTATQRNRVGGPGVLWTPGRRPPHRNGGTFGSFSHERTTINQEVVKKMATKPTRQLTNKATPDRPIKRKINILGARGRGLSRKTDRTGPDPLVLSPGERTRIPPQVLIFFVISSTISLRCRSLPIFFSIVLMEYTTVE